MGVINDLVNKGEENAKTDKEIAYETIVKIFDCNAEDENVKEFATDLSSAIVEFCNGSVAEFTAFEQKYSTLTLQTADTYLGGKVSSLATSLGYDISEFLASNTVAD